MPTVTSSILVPDVELAEVWKVVCDFERYPAGMADVLEVKVLTRESNTWTSRWRVLLNGSEMTWDERDRFEPHTRIQFEQTEGDLEVFRGEWTFLETQGGVEVGLTVEFDLGIPSLAPLLDPVGAQAIRANAAQMLAGIRSRSERE